MIIRKILFKNNMLLVVSSILLSIAGGFIVIKTNENIRTIFNDNILSKSANNFLLMFVVTIVLYFLSFGISILNVYLNQLFTWNGSSNLVKYFFDKLLKTDYEYYTKHQPADIWTNLNTSVQNAANFYASLINCVVRITSVAFYAVIVFSINIYAGIFTLVAIPFYILLTRNAGKKSMKLQSDMFAGTREMSVMAQEAFSNANNLKTKNIYDFFVSKISRQWKKTYDNVVKLNILLNYFRGINGVLNMTVPVLILFAMVNLTDSFNLDAGSIMVLYINIPLLLSGLSGVYISITENNTFKPGLKNLMEIENLPLETGGAKKLTTFESLETHNLKVKFGENRIISVPDIKINKGEKIMLFGESGIGKSTLFNVILGLKSNYGGSVLINETEVKEIDLVSLRKLFGIAFQGGNLFSMTLRENIELDMKLDNKMFDELINITSLSSQINSKKEAVLNDKVVSGGEKSRINLAQTLARNPEILLIDETFSNVDEEMEAAIIKNILKEYKEKTIVCISHRLSSSKYYDRTILTGEIKHDIAFE